jgi:hypothetical protein
MPGKGINLWMKQQLAAVKNIGLTLNDFVCRLLSHWCTSLNIVQYSKNIV